VGEIPLNRSGELHSNMDEDIVSTYGERP